MADVSNKISEFILSLNFNDIPEEIKENVKMRALDIVGLMLPSHSLPSIRAVMKLVQKIDGLQQSTILGTCKKVSLVNAVIANGAMAHSFDYDDTHSNSLVHASACVIPTALALTEALELSGEDFILLATIGYEIITRIGMAGLGRYNMRGFHATSVCGTFSCAAMAARAFGLSLNQTVSALGIAGSFTSGLTQCLRDGADVKMVHPGWAGHGGIMASLLAKEGMTGPSHVFEGELGFLASLLRGEDFMVEKLTNGLGTDWETVNISFKLYPVCHLIHGYLDCIYNLKRRCDLDPGMVEKIECFVPNAIIPIVCEPSDSKKRPDTEYGAKFSLYFSIAAAVLKKHIDLNTFTADTLTDQKILDLAQKVFYSANSFPEFPTLIPGWVKIFMKSGAVLEDRVMSCRGPNGEPITVNDIIDKFNYNTEKILSHGRQEEIIAQAVRIDKEEKINKFLSSLILLED